MNEYSEECILTFLRNQEQLFTEPVAETEEEAEAFLEDCMAAVVDSLEEVRVYFEENGMDVEDMSLEELEDASFPTAKRSVFDCRRINKKEKRGCCMISDERFIEDMQKPFSE